MRKNTIASRCCRLASKYCRIAGVAPAGSENAGEVIRLLERSAGGASWSASITLSLLAFSHDCARTRHHRTRRQRGRRPRQPGRRRARRPTRAITHAARLPGELIEVLGRGRRGTRRRSICSPSPSARVPSPACGSASRRCRGWRWRRASRSCRCRRSTRWRRRGHARAAATLVAPWVDAHRGEVFAAVYEARRGTPMRRADGAAAARDARPRSPRSPPAAAIRFVGDGAVRYADAIAAALGAQADVVVGAPRLAGAIGRIAAAEPASRRRARTRSRRSTSAVRTWSWRATGARAG